MSLFNTVVGIDPSGRRLAVVAVQGGVGNPAMVAPPALFELRSEREPGRLEEAEEALRDFVARNGLAGCEARLCVPADRVFTARIDFPPLRARDLRAALSMEIERIFPFPSSKLRFQWRREGKGEGVRTARLVVVASPSEFVDQWIEIASRVGLSLSGVIPSGWAIAAAHREIGGGGKWPGPVALLRDLGTGVECTVLQGGEPLSGASRSCLPGEAAAEGRALLEEALQDPPGSGTPSALYLAAPSGWFPPGEADAGVAGIPVRIDDKFESRARQAIGDGEGAPWETMGAFGAAAGGKCVDLLARESEGPWPRIAAGLALFLAVTTVLLAVAWPATVWFRAKERMDRLDARVAALAPAVARVGDSMAALAETEERIAILKEAAPGRNEPLEILRELTGRLPQGTWLTGIRLEGMKVEIDGFSPSASEIFPLLTQDGRFRKVEFASPITRQGDNLERFQIRAEHAGAVPAAGEASR